MLISHWDKMKTGLPAILIFFPFACGYHPSDSDGVFVRALPVEHRKIESI
jgi:hypothetical protein